jgi:hypothetical protein
MRRRGLLGGLLAVVAAPALVRAGVLMPVRPIPPPAPFIVLTSRYPGIWQNPRVVSVPQTFETLLVSGDSYTRSGTGGPPLPWADIRFGAPNPAISREFARFAAERGWTA